MNIKQIVKSVLNKTQRKTKVAMLHPGRCGSTVVGSLLNQHPSFYWSGEPFEKLMGTDSLKNEAVIKVIKEREQDRISQVYSFATKYPDGMHLSDNCINKSIPDYIDLLNNLGYSKFILITRANHLKRIVSIIKGRQTGQWHTDQKQDKAKAVEVPIKDFEFGLNKKGSIIDYFKIMDSETKLIIDKIGEKNLLHIKYEPDIEENPVKAYRKICEFVGIKALNPEVKLKKTNPFPLTEMIVNFDEVKKYLQATPYAWMLDE